MTNPNEFESVALRKGSVLIEQGRYLEAVKVFKDSLSGDPDNPHLIHLLATCYYHIPKHLNEALEAIDRSLQLEPDEPYHFNLKAMILADMNKPKQALEAINRSLEMEAGWAYSFAVRSYIYIKKENWPEAERSARDALALNADDDFAGNMLATALNMQNKLDESTHLTGDMLAKDPEDSFAHSSRGWVYFHRKEYDKAQTHFKEALRLNPNFESARIGMLETFKANSRFYRGYLNYAMFMMRQSRQRQVFIIIGIYLVFRTVSRYASTLMDGPFAVFGFLLIALMFLFFFWTWISGGIGNLIVLTDKYARNALNQNEKYDAVFVGGFALAGMALILISAIFQSKVGPLLGAGLVGSTIPFALTFTNDNRVGRYFYGSIGTFIVVASLTGTLTGILGMNEKGSWPVYLLIFAGVAFVVTTWLALFRFLRK